MGDVIAAIGHRLRHYKNLSETLMYKLNRKKVEEPNQCVPIIRSFIRSRMCNSNAFDALEWRKPILENVMEALADTNTHLIGVYGSDDNIKGTLLQRVYRRVQRDQLFDMVVITTVTKSPDVRKIQEDIAHQLEFTFKNKSKDKRANELIHRIKKEQNILIVFYNLYKGFDFSKLGIPYGENHTGCKILPTSTSEDVLSKNMHTQINFMV